MSSSVTRLLFWYIVFLNEKVTLPTPEKKEISMPCIEQLGTQAQEKTSYDRQGVVLA